MQSSLENNSRSPPARQRTLSIAKKFDEKEDIPSPTRVQEASKAAAIIGQSPIPIDSLESSTQLADCTVVPHTASQQKPEMIDTPPPSPHTLFSGGRGGQPLAESQQQRYNRPQTPMDFTFQHKGFGLGVSRASIDDVRAQLAEVREELKIMHEKLAERDLEIKNISMQLDKMMEAYKQAIFDVQKSTKEKDEFKDQVQRLRSAWIAEREARKALEEEMEFSLAKERQLQARIRRMSAQDSLSVLARARAPVGAGENTAGLLGSRRTVNGSSLRGTFPFNQSSPRELQL